MAWDKADVAAAAAGRWREIILGLCSGISREDLIGIHERPCPKCGGSTRFRPWDDFDHRGGVRCNHCFPDRKRTALRPSSGFTIGILQKH